jgi:hypothetical protein
MAGVVWRWRGRRGVRGVVGDDDEIKKPYVSSSYASFCDREETEAEADCQGHAAQGFLRLLELRVVLLQDLVVMRRKFPTHPLWADPVFAPDDYQMFTKDVELSLLEIEEPEEIQIRKTLPAVAERLNTLHQGLARDVAEWDAKTNKRLDAIDARLNDLFEVALLWCSTQCEQPVRPVATITATTTATAVFTPVSTMTSFHSVRTSPVPSERISPSVDASLSALIDKNDNEPPPYLLSRSTSTVPQPWKEWTIGINGGLSVQR